MLVLEASHFPGTRKIMGRKESTTATLLGQHNPLLQSKSYLMHTDTCSYHPSPKKFSSQQVDTITENHDQTQCRGQGIVGSPVPVNTSTALLLHLWLREQHRRGGRKIVRSRMPGSLLGNGLPQKWLHTNLKHWKSQWKYNDERGKNFTGTVGDY